MATLTLQDLAPTPILSPSKHYGIPERLQAEAKRAKGMVFSSKTLPDSVPRQKDIPKLPPGISREAFNTAITELKDLIGETYVEINDKPLIDGWYMEHP